MTSLELDPDLVVWSAAPDARRERPLVVLMHGRGSDEHDIAGLVPSLPPGFVYASVRAPFRFGPGFAWFDDAVETPGDPRMAAGDAAADAVLAWLEALPWVPPAVGALGFSQGGAMSTQLLRRGGGRVSFAVDLAGFALRGDHPGDARLLQERPPVFWGRGEVDAFFTPELVTRTRSWLAAHTSLESAVYPGLGHSVSEEMLRDVVDFLEARR